MIDPTHLASPTRYWLEPYGSRIFGAAPMEAGDYWVINRGANVPTSGPDMKAEFTKLRTGTAFRPPRYLS